MNRILVPLLALLTFAQGALVAVPHPVAFDSFEYEGSDLIFAAPLEKEHFQNPILAGFYPDPSICRVGQDFYLVNSSFSFFPGVPIFHSRDLVHWKQLGFVLDRASQLDLDGLAISEGIFAPTLRYHDGIFYMITTLVGNGGNFYVTAKDPAGPWSDPVWLPFIDGIDPSLFFDDDGRVYITHNGPPPEGVSLYDGHRAVWLWEIDLETNQPVGAGRIVINGGVDLAMQPVWIEAPHVLKKDGWYYLTCAEGGTSDQHSQVIFRTRSLEEPFEPWSGNPILTQRDLPRDRPDPIEATGHADFIELPNGDWWAVFLGVRPYQDGYFNTGRETYLLPMSWEEGWPMILEPGKAIEWRPSAPALAPWSGEAAPLPGNFVWRDSFDGPELGLRWNTLRTPADAWLTFDVENGHALLAPQGADLNSRGGPAFLAFRQQHSSYRASLRLQVPQDADVSAGLAAIIREDHHYFLGLRRASGASGYVAFLEKAENGTPEEIASRALGDLEPGDLEPGDFVTLEMVADRSLVSFFLSAPTGERLAVAEGQDAKILTTAAAWGFVGATMGPYARLVTRE